MSSPIDRLAGIKAWVGIVIAMLTAAIPVGSAMLVLVWNSSATTTQIRADVMAIHSELLANKNEKDRDIANLATAISALSGRVSSLESSREAQIAQVSALSTQISNIAENVSQIRRDQAAMNGWLLQSGRPGIRMPQQ